MQLTNNDLPSRSQSPSEKFCCRKPRQLKFTLPVSIPEAEAVSVFRAVDFNRMWEFSPCFLVRMDRDLMEKDAHRGPVKRAVLQLLHLSQGKWNPRNQR